MGLILLIFCLFSGNQQAWAAAGPWWENEHGAVRLIAADNAVGSSDRLSLGLQFRMKPGWKIYWRSPGDAGFPPKPNWAGSRNLAEVEIAWPRPVRFEVLGLKTLGYKHEVVLPLTVTPFEPGKAVSVMARVPYLTCEEICVPYEATLSLSLPEGPEINGPESAMIARFAARVPVKGPAAGLAVDAALADGPPGGQVVRLAAKTPESLGGPEVLIEGPSGFRFGTARYDGRDANGRAVLLASVSPPPKSVRAGKPADVTGEDLTVTLLTDDAAIEQQVTVARGNALAPPPPVAFGAFATILGLAVLGGLILNLMPCVLPVLSLKMLSVIGHGGAENSHVRAGFLASAAGILVSFLVLGTAAVALKSAGQAAGWGIQFQQPVFLAAMAVIVALFAANLWGVFEIRLPGLVSDSAARVGHGHGLAAHFATGAFAALLATPCSAPFLGTAVGFALSRGAPEIYAIFSALGFGLALPYLLVAAFPALATRLPRPGHWMVTLKRILGLALAGTAVWLLTVLDHQIGWRATLLAAGLLALMIVMLVLRYFLRHSPARSGASGGAAAAAAALALAVMIVPPLMERTEPAETSETAAYWRPFDPSAIAGYVAQGKTVFVDVTADWCVTCKVNKALVLDRDDIVARLNQDDVVAMLADWTRPDPEISAFLKRFGRYGIPFNVVFGPGAPQGRVLPELLTREAVTTALRTAAGANPVATR